MNERAVFTAEIRVSDDGDGRTIAGVAMPWDEVSQGTPHRGGEVFRKGAFKRSLEHHNRPGGRLPRLMYAHNAQVSPVGLPVRVEETDAGLEVEYRMVNTPTADAALLEVREGVLDALSVGFTAVQAPHVRGVREVREARLNEVSLVAMPAYENARVLAWRQLAAVMDLPERPPISLEPIVLGGRAW